MSCLAALCIVGAIAVDGDTLRLPGPNLRLFGIDAPEMSDPRGPASKAALQSLIQGRLLSCEPLYADRYGRIVARCFLPDGTDLSCAMVAAGAASDWPRYSGGAYAGCAR